MTSPNTARNTKKTGLSDSLNDFVTMESGASSRDLRCACMDRCSPACHRRIIATQTFRRGPFKDDLGSAHRSYLTRLMRQRKGRKVISNKFLMSVIFLKFGSKCPDCRRHNVTFQNFSLEHMLQSLPRQARLNLLPFTES